MAAFDGHDEKRLIELVGKGNVAVLEGPLAKPTVLERRALTDDLTLAWAIELWRRRARDLAEVADEASRSTVLSIVYVPPESILHMIAAPTLVGEIVEQRSKEVLKLPLLQPDHVRVGLSLGHFFIVKVSSTRKAIDLRGDPGLDPGPRFRDKKYRYTFDGTGYARNGKYLAVDGSTVPISSRARDNAVAIQANTNEVVVVNYLFHGGITLSGNTKPHKDRIAATRGQVPVWNQSSDDLTWKPMPFSFRWSGKQQVWYVPGSRNQLFDATAIEEIADALQRNGVPALDVIYGVPTQPSGLPWRLPKRSRVQAPAELDPPGWPPLPIPEAAKPLNSEGQLRRIPRYGRDDYRWHEVLLSHRGETPVVGVATNILGHRVIGKPPTAIGGDFWVLLLDGERWGRGDRNFRALAQKFHDNALPALEPLPVAESGGTIEEAKQRVKARQARSKQYTDAAKTANVPVCPLDVFLIHPVAAMPEQIQERGKLYARLVHAHRALRQFELYALGKRKRFPVVEAKWLPEGRYMPSQLDEPGNQALALAWAKAQYETVLANVVDEMKADNPGEAKSVIDFCVRDVESGARRQRPEKQAQLRQMLEQPRVRPPAEAPPSKPHIPAPKVPRSDRSLLAAWKQHLAGQQREDWPAIPETDCFDASDGVTVCPANQTKPVGACPPSEVATKDKARQVMLCGDEQQPLVFVRSMPDARPERDGLAQRKRMRTRSNDPLPPLPAAADFAGQERFLDRLVPSRHVFLPERPFELHGVHVAAPHVKTANDGRPLDVWYGPIPSDASYEARVRVGSRELSLQELVPELKRGVIVPYTGPASPKTIAALVQRMPAGGAGFDQAMTANDVQHGVFEGRSLYWLHNMQTGQLIGPVDASGKLGPRAVRDQMIIDAHRVLDLPKDLPHGWTLDDAVVLAVTNGGKPTWLAWHPASERLAVREVSGGWSQTRELVRRAEWDSQRRTYADFPHEAYAGLARMLERPGPVRFRIAGPWLGWVWPSDYGVRVVFDPPTGGELDLQRLEAGVDEYKTLAAKQIHDRFVPIWMRLAPKRLAWAKRYLAEQGRKSKPKRDRAPRPEHGLKFTAAQRQAMAIASNAWTRGVGESTNYNGRKEVNTAKSLIAAGYLEQTGSGTFGGQPELLARLTPKGRRWVLENLGPHDERERAALEADLAASATTAAPKPAPEPRPAKPKRPTMQAELQVSEQIKTPARPRTAAKKRAVEQPTKPATAASSMTPSKSAAKRSAGKARTPNWRYTTHRDVRHRFRELDGTFVVERQTPTGWTTASAAAARAIHEKSESACALAARILPTCRGGKTRLKPPSEAEKQSMRKLLGL